MATRFNVKLKAKVLRYFSDLQKPSIAIAYPLHFSLPELHNYFQKYIKEILEDMFGGDMTR